MMAGNPNWWTMNGGMHQQSQQLSSTNYLSPSSSHDSQYLQYGSSSLSSTSLSDQSNQEYPRSWSQLLLGGLGSDQDRLSTNHCEYNRLENWEEHGLNPSLRVPFTNVKQEDVTQSRQLYGHVNYEEYQASRLPWPPQVNLVSSPSSCVTSLSSNLLNFTSSKADRRNIQHSNYSTEGNSSSTTGGLAKRPRVQQSSVQPALKVRKEKLGDRITALHQLVSPFGKTDTASVLSEAIGYIRFLLGQIEALSSPYLGNVSKSLGHQHSVQERNCLFPEEHGQDGENHPMDLKSRGLCLVPLSCTQHVGSDNAADYWAPSLGGGF